MPTPASCPKCGNVFDLEAAGDCPSCGWSSIDDDSPPGRFERSMRWVLIVSNVVLVVAMLFLFQDLFADRKHWTVVFFSVAVAAALLSNLVALRHIHRRERSARDNGGGRPEAAKDGGRS